MATLPKKENSFKPRNLYFNELNKIKPAQSQQVERTIQFRAEINKTGNRKIIEKNQES